MCRSIKRLRRAEGVVASEEVAAAALQFVRKISGYRQPSGANAAAFDDAVREVTEASQRLLGRLRDKKGNTLTSILSQDGRGGKRGMGSRLRGSKGVVQGGRDKRERMDSGFRRNDGKG